MNTPDLAALQRWIDSLYATTSECFVALDAVPQPVVASSRLTGPNANAALEFDAAVQRARALNDPALVAQSIAASPATGCAMVMTVAMNACGYNPAAPGAAANVAGYEKYIVALSGCPLLTMQLNDVISPNMSGDWGSVIGQIVSNYTGISAADLGQLRSSLWSIAQAASGSPGTNETLNLFVQNTLNAGDDLVLYLYDGAVAMVTTVQSGGKHSPDTVTNNAAFQLHRNIFTFDSAGWPAYAPLMIPRTTATLTSWLANNATPQGTLPVNWNG